MIQILNVLTKKSEYKLIYTVGMCIVLFNISSPFFGNTTIHLGFMTGFGEVLLDIIPFCIANMLLDIYTNQYGWQNAKKLIYFIILTRVVVVVAISIMLLYHTTFLSTNYLNLVRRGLLSGVIAGYIAFLFDCYIFCYIYTYFNGKFIWLRCITATTAGELIYSLISNFMYLTHIYTIRNIFAITVNINIFMFLFEIATLPITWDC